MTAPLTAVDLTSVKTEVAQRALDVLGLPASGRSLTAATHAADATWSLLWGTLRGRVPMPIPQDLMAVATGATIRLTQAYERHDAVSVKDLTTNTAPPLTAVGFTLAEMVTLHRYRVRTV